MQPLYKDPNGVVRFKPNKIVDFLLEWCRTKGGIYMNELAIMPFEQEDREQFVQLIGYSLSGFGELSYVRDETYEKASKMAEEMKSDDRPQKKFGGAWDSKEE
jgi:hypothetical protein